VERFEDPDDQPNLFPLRSVLAEMRDYTRSLVTPESTEEEAAEAGVAGSGAVAGPAGAINTRQDALKRLQDVGDYFRRAEPHSPISHLITRAIRWGGMSFEELLQDLARNDDVIKHIWEKLGIDKSGASEE